MISHIELHCMCSFADVITEVEVEPLTGKVHFNLNDLHFRRLYVCFIVGAISMSTLFHVVRLEAQQ